jgi:iron complex transport system permease protein
VNARRWLACSLAAFVIAAVLLPLLGPSSLDLSRVWRGEEPDRSIFVYLRLSRTLLGLFAGAALALGGSVFQAILRDSLATPYTLGVSTGASLGAVVAIAAGWSGYETVPPAWIGALIGAAAALVLVVGSTKTPDGLSPYRLLLAGIALNSVCSALILLVYGLSGMSASFAIARWLIGSLDAIAFAPLVLFILLVSVLAAMIVRHARSWTLLSIGEMWAATRGVDVPSLTTFGYLSGSVLAAVTVAVAGPIGFIGLIVPHLIRVRVSSDARILMPCAFCLGGVLLAGCDAIGRTVIAPAEVPAGAITACIGGPYLIWLVRQRA